MPTCSEGHATEATDYCTVCGSPVEAPAATAAAATSCAACGATISDRFCEFQIRSTYPGWSVKHPMSDDVYTLDGLTLSLIHI